VFLTISMTTLAAAAPFPKLAIGAAWLSVNLTQAQEQSSR
jgi:hypothetical protein